MLRFILSSLALLSLCVLPAAASAEVLLSGELKQGGYIYGTAPLGAKVYLDKTELKLDEKGRFFAGLHRNYPKNGNIHFEGTDGAVITTAFTVEPQAYEVQHVKGVAKKHVNPDPKQVKRSRREAGQIIAARKPFTPLQAALEKFDLPVANYPLSGIYGSSRTFNGEERSWHKGLDIAAPEGTPVIAPADGIVRAALPDTFFNGNIVVVDHGLGVFSIYAHLSGMAVTEGQQISRGELIGQVGETGRATGPHLHWGIYWHNIALDPKLFLADNIRNNL